jgi:pimeloyl-ACP methyl ester carboxylesterase
VTVFLTLLLVGCESSPETETAAVVEGTATAPDGISLAYDVRGAGATTLLFIHGWCCDRSFWRAQLDAFADEYRVVALDLAGHGQSAGGRDPWSIAAFGPDVLAVAEELDLDRVVLIGHSMGGPVSLHAAARLGDRVLGVVGVDTLHNAEFEMPQAMLEQVSAAFEADFEGTMTGFVRSAFAESADPQLVEWATRKALAADPAMAVALLRDFLNVDLKALFSSAGVPVRCINAAADPPARPATAAETNRRYADFDAVLIDDVGHFPHLERPEEFNVRLRETLAKIVGS